MTIKIGNVLFIKAEEPSVCEFCGKLEELRPYGPNKENICFDCAMKDPETTKKKFQELVES